MNKWMKMTVVVVIVGLLGGIGYILWGPKEDLAGRHPNSTEFTDIHFIHEENGRKIAEVFAEAGDANLKNQMGTVKNLRVFFYRENGTVWKLTSPDGTIGDKGKKITLNSPIKAEDQDGSYILCENGTGVFTIDDKKIQLEGNIKAMQKDVVITGSSLFADIELSHVKIKGNQVKLIKGGSSK